MAATLLVGSSGAVVPLEVLLDDAVDVPADPSSLGN
jgi:hypothetical protein